jgi:hypothetical protein
MMLATRRNDAAPPNFLNDIRLVFDTLQQLSTTKTLPPWTIYFVAQYHYMDIYPLQGYLTDDGQEGPSKGREAMRRGRSEETIPSNDWR